MLFFLSFSINVLIAKIFISKNEVFNHVWRDEFEAISILPPVLKSLLNKIFLLIRIKSAKYIFFPSTRHAFSITNLTLDSISYISPY